MSDAWSVSDWRGRLTGKLEPLLKHPQLTAEISTYKGVPFALFVYPPTDERELRREVKMLATRVEQESPRKVYIVSLAELMWEAIRRAHPPDGQALFDAERSLAYLAPEERLEKTAEHMRSILSDVSPLPEMIRARVAELDPSRSIVFLLRVGALFPAYRASVLLENLMGNVRVPTVLFYPGTRIGKNLLRFMDSLEAIHSYRHKIF